LTQIYTLLISKPLGMKYQWAKKNNNNNLRLINMHTHTHQVLHLFLYGNFADTRLPIFENIAPDARYIAVVCSILDCWLNDKYTCDVSVSANCQCE